VGPAKREKREGERVHRRFSRLLSRNRTSSEYSVEGNPISPGIHESRKKRFAEKLSDRRRFLDWELNEQRARANAIAIGRGFNQFPAAVLQLRRGGFNLSVKLMAIRCTELPIKTESVSSSFAISSFTASVYRVKARTHVRANGDGVVASDKIS
jgi:hypothetical protein